MSAECSAENIPSGYKHTKVGVIPEDWETTELIDKANVIDSLHQTPSFSNDGFPMVRVSDIKPGKLDLSKTLKVCEVVFTEFTRSYKPKRGDIVLSRVGSYGISSFVETDEPFCMGQNTVVIEPRMPALLLYYILNSPIIRQQIEDNSFGTGYKSLSLKSIKELKITIPSTKTEQESIAEALSDADALIESLEQLIAKKRQIKQGAMQELLNGKKRLPGFATKLGYKQTEVGVIPEDWEITGLIEKANVIDSLHQTPSFSEDGFPMVRVSDIKPGNLDLSRTFKVCEKVFTEFIRNYKPKRGDIVLSRVGSYGVSSFVETEELFCMGQNTVVIEPKMPARLLYYVLNSPIIRQQIEDNSFGTGYKSLSLKSIKELKIAIPPTKAEQEAIANILSDIDSEIAALEEKLAKARQIKQGMMQELLTGRIRLI